MANNGNRWLADLFCKHGRFIPALIIIGLSMVSGLIGYNVRQATLDIRLTVVEAEIRPLKATLPEMSGDIRVIKMDLERLRESFDKLERRLP